MEKNEIRFYRMKKGITQTDLAAKVGVSQQAVAKWESGKASVSSELILKLEKALGVRKEILFPELRQLVRTEVEDKEILDEKMEIWMPYEVIFHFKSNRASYWSPIDGKNYDRIVKLLTATDIQNIWFETQDGLIVSINRTQIASFEIGRDFGSLPEKIIERQEIGEIDPDAEENGDDRLVRLFVQGFEEPFADNPDTDTNGPTLMMILSDALGDFLHLDEFCHFDLVIDDERTVYFRPEKFELIECPIAAHEEYSKNMLRQEGATEEEIANIYAEVNSANEAGKKGKRKSGTK